MTDKTKVIPVGPEEGKIPTNKEGVHNKPIRTMDEEKVKVDKFINLESASNFNKTMKRLTDYYFATSLEGTKNFGGQIQRTNNLMFRMHDVFTSVITTSRERLEQNPFEFGYDKKKLQGEIDTLLSKLHSEEETTKSQAQQILELEKNELHLENSIQTQEASIEKLNAAIEELNSDKAKLVADKEQLHLKSESVTKENQESIQRIEDLQKQLHELQQELQEIGKLEREKSELEQQLSVAVETHKNEIIQISKQKEVEKQSEMSELQQKLLTNHQKELSKEDKKREELNNTVLELNQIIQKQKEDALKEKNQHVKKIEELNKKAITAKRGYEAQLAKLKKEIASLKHSKISENPIS